MADPVPHVVDGGEVGKEGEQVLDVEQGALLQEGQRRGDADFLDLMFWCFGFVILGG